MNATTRRLPSGAPLPRLGRALADAWTITLRDLNHWALRPGTVIVGWLFPVMTVLMFGGLFGGAISVPGGGGYFEFLMPGMFTLTMLFGLETTMTAVTTDAARGVTDRFRSLPMSSSAVVLGRCAADMLNSVGGLAVMIGAGLLLGWSWHGGPGAALAAVGLLLLLRFALLWVGIFIGLAAGGPEAVTSVQILVWPVGFLSGVFVDPATMPAWLGAIAAWNPLSATAAAARELFGNPGHGGGSWIEQHAMLMAAGWPVLLVAVFLPLSARTFRRLKG
ncbi:ABC transporter permease [Planomonospora venezuelensis]|uniref:Transport permease protein n=1 Tax=Planomonospora venezuelensis TaxID=1999 RepID=A0A841D7C9_PLAVE|nr:ABC transporter permease [Planomonospora venezuelensis]MBB5964397.1 ABC-2 type transport system permease protein [Planomonospora venezuelensis]GIN02008.1 transport permease protein [Planomonospora venezuelensis]